MANIKVNSSFSVNPREYGTRLRSGHLPSVFTQAAFYTEPPAPRLCEPHRVCGTLRLHMPSAIPSLRMVRKSPCGAKTPTDLRDFCIREAATVGDTSVLKSRALCAKLSKSHRTVATDDAALAFSKGRYAGDLAPGYSYASKSIGQRQWLS